MYSHKNNSSKRKNFKEKVKFSTNLYGSRERKMHNGYPQRQMWSKAETRTKASIQFPLYKTCETHVLQIGDSTWTHFQRKHEVLGPFSCPPLVVYMICSNLNKEKCASMFIFPFCHKDTTGKFFLKKNVQSSLSFCSTWEFIPRILTKSLNFNQVLVFNKV
jgi:hypothetical protein